MVCIMEEDEQAFCVVRDYSGISQDWKVEMLVSASTTGKQFLRDIADRYNFEPDSFRLVSPTPCKKNNAYQAVITEDSEETLKDFGINFESGCRNLFIVEGLNGDPRLVTKTDDLELGASASPEEPSSSNSSSPPLLTQIPDRSFGSCMFTCNDRGARRKPRTSPCKSVDSPSPIEYRGLVNQAMTCYLNSLLQALFMTPEFRNALYNWKFVLAPGIDESKSIPYQLQRLFLNLQTSPRDSVETTELTRSFGWDSSEAWQQHDIQELCRVMFDALEHEFKGTEQADLINGLYQGKMIDYVQCLECGTEKNREDTFLDIPLPVRPFGSNTAYGSVEEALRAFVQPEMLEGNNQYFCEKCNKKCNAHKGLKFSRFPYLLTLHLMRFDFDYNTMHRIKLSDKVSFPQTLDLNNFIPFSNVSSTSPLYKDEGSEGFPEEITGSSSKCDDSSTTDSGSAIDDESCMASSNDNVDYEQEVDEGIDVSNQMENEKNRNHNAETGPYVYELFSIMVHSGSASGGHYYAYIKDFETGDWYCFNDQNVHKITSEQIETSFGGYGPSRGYYSGVYSSSMNAYMLMYRQIDKERNVLPLKEEKFPPHIKALLNELTENAKNYRKIKEKEREMCKIKVYVQHPASDKRIDCKIDCETREPLKEVLEKAYKKLQLETTVPLERCRLVLYSSHNDSIQSGLEGKENEEIGTILSSVCSTRKHEMLMEIRHKDKPFPLYKPGSVPTIKVLPVHLEKNRIDDKPITLRISLSDTVEEFRNELYHYLDYDPHTFKLFIMLEAKGNTAKFMDGDEKLQLRNCGELPNAKVFVCFKATDGEIKCRNLMRTLVQQHLNVVKLNVILPDIKPDVLKKWSIPTLSEYINSNCNSNSNSNSVNHTKYCEELVQPQEKDALNDDSEPLNNANHIGSQTISHSNSSPVLPSLLNAPPLNAEELYSNEMNGASITIGGHHSDQSASEDSSLTDSDRTIIGETQEDCQMSSSGSSPGGGDVRDRLINDSDERYYNAWNRNTDDTDVNESNDNLCDFHFKEICNNVTIDKKKNIKIEVDKRMPIDIFKKKLEQYVQAPSNYFKICAESTVNSCSLDLYNAYQSRDADFSSRIDINTLESIENDATLHVKLNPPPKPNTLKVKLFIVDYKANRIESYIDDFPIDEEKTVGETKKDLVQFLRCVHNVNINLERCRLRILSSGIKRVCLNDEIWANLKLQNEWSLYVQELDSNESIVDPDREINLPIRRYNPATRMCGPIQEIIRDDFAVDGIKTKISEVSDIPIENLILSLQEITHRTNNSSIEWEPTSNSSFMEKWPNSLKEVNHMIVYKDNREEVNDVSLDRKRIKKVGRLEKPLRIHVAEKTPCPAEATDSKS